MSLLKTFRDYMRVCKDKNLLIRPAGQQVNLLPVQLVKEITYPSEQITKEKQNDAQLVDEYQHKLGKGSMFERKNVESYLKPLGNINLKRADIQANESFQEQVANENHKFQKNIQSLENSSTVLFNLEQENIREILEKLIAVTPKSNDPTEPPRIALNDAVKASKKKRANHIYTEIPPVPEFGENTSLFEDYIYQLTHSTFHFKSSSKFNGIISKILKNLFHPLNSNSIALRTVNSYNDVIFFYSIKWNIATCRELLVQMRLENVRPNTTTFNIMLKSLLTHQNIRHVSDPYKIASSYFNEMKKYGVKADLVTWNLVFNLFKDDISKKLLLENRKLLGLPADPHFIRSVFKYLSFKEEITSRNVVSLVKEYDLPMDSKLLSVLLKKLIKENHIFSAWKVIDHARTEFNFSPCVGHLNLFLVQFSNIGRIDLVVATLNTFRKRFRIKPDYDSYNLVMKSISRSRNWDGKLAVLRVLYHQMIIDLKNCIAGEYWIRRIRARLKFIYDKDVNLKSELTTEEIELKDFMGKLRWKLDSKKDDLSRNIPDEYKEITALLGYSPWAKKADHVEIEDIEYRKKRVLEYKNRLSGLAIQKSLVERIPYANDSYAALKKEMKERNLLK